MDFIVKLENLKAIAEKVGRKVYLVLVLVVDCCYCRVGVKTVVVNVCLRGRWR